MEIGKPRRKRLLVVDDNELILQLVSRQLSAEGYDVVAVSSANDAIGWCDVNGSPDLLLSDVSMPEIDGPTLYHSLDSKFPGLPALFMSAAHGKELSGIPWPLLEKPFTRDQLRSLINVSLFQAYLTKAELSHGD
ncbi:MAG: response regulator [Pseudomonadales bacterium]